MSVDYYDTNKLRGELDAFDKVLEKLAFTPTAAPPPPMTQMPPQGAPPMDPSMMQGGAPMDPAMAQGAGMPMDPSGQPMPPQGAPMDPSMMQGGMPPADPAAQGGGMAPELEGALAELATSTQRMGEEVGAQRDQIDQLTQRLL